jgi:hypothetical protein
MVPLNLPRARGEPIDVARRSCRTHRTPCGNRIVARRCFTSTEGNAMIDSRKELYFFIAVGGLIVVAVTAVVTRFI